MLEDKTQETEAHEHSELARNLDCQSSTRIFVNAREKHVTAKQLSYTDVVRLAFEDAVFNENTAYTVTYRSGRGHKLQGSMVEGDTVKVREGMKFNVTRTDKS
jgi:hypothetical protein